MNKYFSKKVKSFSYIKSSKFGFLITSILLDLDKILNSAKSLDLNKNVVLVLLFSFLTKLLFDKLVALPKKTLDQFNKMFVIKIYNKKILSKH